jgi:hypothetical protein
VTHENKNKTVNNGAREPVKRKIFVSKSTMNLQLPPSLGLKKNGKMNQHRSDKTSMAVKINTR